MEQNEENSQEIMFKLSMFDQQIRQLQQQLQMIDQTLSDIQTINYGLDELVGAEGKEILAPIGRGIFVKAKLLSEELTVDIGDKNFVKKDIPGTKKIIEKQIKKLEDVRKEIEKNQDELTKELEGMLSAAQKNN